MNFATSRLRWKGCAWMSSWQTFTCSEMFFLVLCACVRPCICVCMCLCVPMSACDQILPPSPYSLLVAVHHLTRPPGVVQQEVERQQRRQQRLRTNSTVAMPELPVDKSVRMHGARAGTTPTSLDRISLDPSAMLASYERSSTTQVHGSSYQSSPTLPRSNGKDRLLPTTIGESSACYKPEKIFYESGERSDMESTPAPVPLHRSFAGGLLTEPVERVDSSNSYGHNDQLAAAATVPERQQSICYIGLIDIFQKYTLNKRAERFYKVHVRRKDPAGVSVMPVEPYAKRFMEKMEAIFV